MKDQSRQNPGMEEEGSNEVAALAEALLVNDSYRKKSGLSFWHVLRSVYHTPVDGHKNTNIYIRTD